jgi:hypothetical protein
VIGDVVEEKKKIKNKQFYGGKCEWVASLKRALS